MAASLKEITSAKSLEDEDEVVEEEQVILKDSEDLDVHHTEKPKSNSRLFKTKVSELSSSPKKRKIPDFMLDNSGSPRRNLRQRIEASLSKKTNTTEITDKNSKFN